jgi:hypothetical protein
VVAWRSHGGGDKPHTTPRTRPHPGPQRGAGVQVRLPQDRERRRDHRQGGECVGDMQTHSMCACAAFHVCVCCIWMHARAPAARPEETPWLGAAHADRACTSHPHTPHTDTCVCTVTYTGSRWSWRTRLRTSVPSLCARLRPRPTTPLATAPPPRACCPRPSSPRWVGVLVGARWACVVDVAVCRTPLMACLSDASHGVRVHACWVCVRAGRGGGGTFGCGSVQRLARRHPVSYALPKRTRAPEAPPQAPPRSARLRRRPRRSETA